MMYKLEVLSDAAQSKEHFYSSLEEVLEGREKIKESLNEVLNEALAIHVENTGCDNPTCKEVMRLKHFYFAKFRISIARWEVIG